MDLFFTLSGYLITRLLLREREQTGDINLRAFYARRTLRIWPLYYFSLALAFLLTRIPASITSAPPYLGNAFAPMRSESYFFMAIFLFNFNFANCLLTNPLPFMAHLWSISVEEQFYLFWPWFARYVPRRRIVVIPIVMIAVACIARAISLPLKLDAPSLEQHFHPSRSYCRGNFDSAFAKAQSAACSSPGAGAGRLCELAVRLILLWITFSAQHAENIDGLSCRCSWQRGFPAGDVGGKESPLRLRAGSLPDLSGQDFLWPLCVQHDRNFNGQAVPVSWVFGTLVAAGHPPWSALPIYVLLAFGLNVALAAVSYRWLEAPFLRLKERFTRVPSRAV